MRTMIKLIGVVKPLLHVMICAVLLGVMGFICAIGIPVAASYGVASVFDFVEISHYAIVGIIILFAILRGILRYGEQACNHYIAFKILAIIRNRVFTALRKLSPAKMEGRKKGDLIAILTSDIELLEVFYAHTVSPVIIAIIVSVCVMAMLYAISPILSIIALFAFVVIGLIIPVLMSKKGGDTGLKYRNDFAELNSTVFDSLRGIDEILQYGYVKVQYNKIKEREKSLNSAGARLKNFEGVQRGITDAAILLFTFIMLVVSAYLYGEAVIQMSEVIVGTVLMASSFGPVVALANLSNNLNQTLASGKRVLDILEEKPVVEDVDDKEKSQFGDVSIENLSFAYEDKNILEDINLEIKQNSILGIVGKSGSGKSTLLKLLMRFWKVENGKIKINGKSIDDINTDELRDMQSYVTQETWLFNDTIFNNIIVANPMASKEEVVEACKRAGIDEFIQELPEKYDTNIGELGNSLSGGERQRIGIARAFLHNSPMVLLDEPTSNLDSLNESYVLNSIEELSKEKTVVLVSHRQSTMGFANEILRMNSKRNS